MEKKNLYILGVTGSIGMQTLDIVRKNPDRYNVVSVSANKNIEKMREIIKEFRPLFVSMGDFKYIVQLKKEFEEINYSYGEEGLIDAAIYNKGDKKGVLVNSVVGSIGLKPTIEAIKIKRDIALANKETLVIAGELIRQLVNEYNVNLLPIDSEHSAIMQCLNGEDKKSLKRIIITASGGSFRDKTRDELSNVSLQDALNHPNWSMGAKITIDSATMMNKGLEVIEAHWLFDVEYDRIDTILHKESVIHSMVEYNDTSIIAHLGNPDMGIPIQYALSYPDRVEYKSESLNLFKYNRLSFKEMDFKRFPCIKMAYDAGRLGGIMPCVLNAANEAAVDLFLNNKIEFLDIEYIIEDCLNNFDNIKSPTLEEILYFDELVKDYVYNKYK